MTIDIAAAAQDPAIAALDLGCLGEGDLLNLVLQRSEVLFDQPAPGRVVKAWNAGDDAPARAVVKALGHDIARRAAAVIRSEYLALEPLLRTLGPARIADIGCGYGFFDLFAARALGAGVLLIDLETNDLRHFGFSAEGAAYSSLSRARALLEANGVPAAGIETLNPRETAPEDARPVDLAVSFLSCGFHYPVDPYLPFLERTLGPGGAAILDLRAGKAAGQAAKLERLGPLTDLTGPPKTRRVLLRKATGTPGSRPSAWPAAPGPWQDRPS
jgi:SAM-dependent methyltransferase